jgi:hypothetical protein
VVHIIGFLWYSKCMMEETVQPRRRGRPATGETPKRNLRMGQLWDDCEAQAKADGESMTAFVTEALARELARRRRNAARK